MANIISASVYQNGTVTLNPYQIQTFNTSQIKIASVYNPYEIISPANRSIVNAKIIENPGAQQKEYYVSQTVASLISAAG